jgi:transposase
VNDTRPTTRDRVQQLTAQGLKVREIAAILNVSTQAVYKHLKALEIDPPTRQDNGEPAA